MKKLILIVLILSLILPVLEAKVVNITKTDFYIEPRQAYRLEQGDGIFFTKDNKEYVISLDEIGKDSLRLKSFAYKNDTRETFYVILSQKFSNKIDFERDNVNDMQITLLKIWDNRTKADILFEALNETKTQNTKETPSKPFINSQTKAGLIIAGLIVVIGLLVYFAVKKR